MTIPTLPADKIVAKAAIIHSSIAPMTLTPVWDQFLSILINALQEVIKENGITMPDTTTLESKPLATTKNNGTVFYNPDTHKYQAIANGIVKTFAFEP